MRVSKRIREEFADHLAMISPDGRCVKGELAVLGRLKLRLLVWVEVRLGSALLHIHNILVPLILRVLHRRIFTSLHREYAKVVVVLKAY